MRKSIKIFLISIAIFIALVISGAFVIGFFYEDAVLAAVLKEVNKKIKTEISFKDYEFSVFSKFPNASLEFKEVVAKSTKKFKSKYHSNDTLFIAKSIFLQFNIFDIIKENYTIKAIQIDDADIRALTNKKGDENFLFWESDSTEIENFKLELTSIKLTNTKILYYNEIRKSIVVVYTNKFSLKGNFTEDSYILKSNGKLNIEKLEFSNVNYATAENISIESDIKVDNKNFKIKSGKLLLNELSFNIDGSANYEKNLMLDLKLSGNNIDIKSLLSALPEIAKSKISEYNSDGLFYFDGTIKGEISNYSSPKIEANFGIKNATITNTTSNISMTNVNAKGKFSNGSKKCAETSYLQLDTLETIFNGNKINGSYKITNFKSPKVYINSDINTELNDLIKFASIDTIESISGHLNGHLDFEGNFSDFNNISKADIARSKSDGYAIFTNVSLKLKDSNFEISNINTGLKFNNKNIEIDSLRFIQGNNDFLVKGYIYNILQYLLIDEKNVQLTGTLKSENFDLEEFLKNIESKNNTSENTNLNVAEFVTYNLYFFINNFKYKKFAGKNLNGELKYLDKTISLNNLSINTLDGFIEGNIFIQEIDSTKFKLTTNPTLTNINIEKMFYVFNNFGQDFIKSDNLKGTINSINKISFLMNEKAQIDETSLTAISDIEILKGELNNFEPMKNLSRFIALSELENIKFNNIKNQIRIENKTIFIPKMDINSSAFTITLGGEHYFNGEFNYKLKVLMSDFLYNKAKKSKKQNTEFGVVEDDGLGQTSLFLNVSGNANNFNITYDTKAVKENIKEKAIEEKSNLKTILNDEFGWFKKDTEIVKTKEKNLEIEKTKKKKKVAVQWDDD